MDPLKAYDQLAPEYDAYYQRCVDLAEDQAMAELLIPLCHNRSVVDLACGTGHLLDLGVNPSSYLGVDGAPRMLEQLVSKHPSAATQLADLREFLPVGLPHVQVVTVLWAASYLPLSRWFFFAEHILVEGGWFFLHGYGPPYAHRPHYVLDGSRPDLFYLTRANLMTACRGFRFRVVCIRGLNALPDWLGEALPSRAVGPAMKLSRRLPLSWSYHLALVAQRT